jgi:hypothetical protein
MYNDGNGVTTPGNILVIMGISNYQELMLPTGLLSRTSVQMGAKPAKNEMNITI